MPTVTTAFAKALVRAAGYALDPDGGIRSGNTVVHRVNPYAEDQLDAGAYFHLLEWLCRCNPDRLALVSAYATALRADDLGVFGLALKTAPTLGASLRRLERYYRLLTDTVAYRLEYQDDAVLLVLDDHMPDHPATALRNEGALAGIARKMACFAHQDPGFEHVTFRHECHGDPAGYQAFFGCPVQFGANRDAIALPNRALELPNRLGDAAVSDFFTRHLDKQLGAREGAPRIKDELLHRLSKALSTGVPQAAALASEMGMSERTFFRRLSDEGTTFRDVVREAQVNLARELLAHSQCSIAEVAFLTGFAEQSTFGRAFKRWVGQAPAQFRNTLARKPVPLRRAALAGNAQSLAGRADTMRSPAL